MRRLAWMVLGGVLAAAAGCLDWDSGIPCRTDRHCPTGKHCAEGICEAGTAAADAGEPPDAGDLGN